MSDHESCDGGCGRRDFIRSAFAAAGAAAAAPAVLATGNPVPPSGGDANILELHYATRASLPK